MNNRHKGYKKRHNTVYVIFPLKKLGFYSLKFLKTRRRYQV